MPNYVPGIGGYNPKLMIIGEAPGRYENEQMQPFVGPTGQMLNEYLYKAGISRNDCYLTNVVKYQPPFNDIKKLHLINIDLNEQIESLWTNEIRRIRPNCILCIGDLALQAVTGYSGILNYRGSILRSKDGDFKCIATIHPAALFSRYGSSEEQSGGLDYVYSKLIQADIQRAVDESVTSNFNLPDRHLIVAHNSLDLFRFLREYENLDKVSCDIESINCIPVCVGFAFNKHHAISVPLFRSIGKTQLTDMGDSELDECWRMIDVVLRTKKLIGHNFKYDDYKLGLTGFDCRTVYSDTLIKTRVIFPELPSKKLNVLSSLWTREPYYKEEGKEFKIGKSRTDQLFLYNAKDCAVTFEIDEAQESDLVSMQETYSVPLVDYYYGYMMRKHKFYLKMENNGFAVDHQKQLDLRAEFTQMQKEVHLRLEESIGHELNVKSTPQMYSLLYKEMKFKPYKLAPTSEDAIVKLIGNHCKSSAGAAKKVILEDILEERRIRDQKSRYINFTPDYDGSCKSSFNISATETCRSSTSVIKKPLRPKKIGLAFHTISKHGRLARDIRSMFIPREGKIFIQADSSQAEARVVAVLCEDWTLLDAFDTVDIHRRTAALILGLTAELDLVSQSIPSDLLIGKDSPERFCGKKTRHAGNYDMKAPRFTTEFNTDAQKFEINMSVSQWKAGQMLEKFHSASPRIKNIFHQSIKDAIDSSRVLIDPFGGVRVFHGRMDDSLYQEAYANIPQRSIAHLVQGAALKIEDELSGDIEHSWISENHDSLLMEVPANNWEDYARLMKKHMMTPIDFSLFCTLKRDYSLTIPADIEFSDTNYGQMVKVKI